MKMRFLSMITAGLLVSGMAFAQETTAPAPDQTQDVQSEQNMNEESTDQADATAQSDIVTLAMETQDLSTLVEAVKAAGLVETLQGEGPFTVFAPTNAAFEALPEGTLEELLKPENKEKLAKVLTFHVLPVEVTSGQLQDGMSSASVEGSDLKFMKQGQGFAVEGAAISKADVEASNGVVHIIDQVILPPDMKDTATNK